MIDLARQAFTVLLLIAGQALAEPAVVEFSSGDSQVTLIELYTSEGCSSCPPAERWLNTLKAEPGLWEQFVPVALHVDYWDYIGWTDRFARPDHSKRQRRYAAEGGSQGVYTPGVFANGRAWLGWRGGAGIESSASAPGSLALRLEGRDLAVHFAAADTVDRDLMLHVALLGMGLETRVRAGENKGRTLAHDFVALDLRSMPLERAHAGYRVTTELPASRHAPEQLALVAWVSSRDALAPIQAVGGFLPVGP